MKKLKTILAAINMSVFDNEVIKRAVLIAKDNDAQLHFVYVVDIPVLDIKISSVSFNKTINKDKIKKEIAQKIDAVEGSGNIEYFIHIDIGDAIPQIIHYSEKIYAELIILGSHSKMKIEDYYLGSTVVEIAQKSALPVLVIKNSAVDMYKNILAPTDLSESSKESILFAKTVFKYRAISLVYAYEKLDDLTMDYLELSSNENSDESACIGRTHVSIFKEDVGVSSMKMIKETSSSINKSLLGYIMQENNDLIVIGSSGRYLLGSYLDSTGAFLLRNVHTDILVKPSV